MASPTRAYGPNVHVTRDSLWQRTPVFHSWQPGVREGDRFVARTGCGLVAFEDGLWRMMMMPSRHVVKFGRPCRNCWPGGGA